jgi:hypothetical protein
MTGAVLTAIATNATPLNAGGTFIMAWLQSTLCPNTNAAWTYSDLKQLGYREHTVASLLSDDPPSVEMSPSDQQINDHNSTYVPTFNLYSRTGYLILIGTSLFAGSQLTINLDMSGLWWGSSVQGIRKVVISQAAIDCVASCLVNSRHDSSLGASNPYGGGTTKSKARNISDSAGWYSMITTGGVAALNAAKSWATNTLREYLPSAFI